MKDALKATGLGTRREVVELGLGRRVRLRLHEQIRRLMTSLELVELGGHDLAIQAARNLRRLRERGVTVRKTIDTVIATRCIESDLVLLHADRDFDPFVEYLGLRVVPIGA